MFVIADCNFAHIPIKPIFLDVENSIVISTLQHPNIVGLLGGLTGAINGVDLDVLLVLRLPGMNHDHNMHVVVSGHFAEPRHHFVLQIELLVPFRLLR